MSSGIVVLCFEDCFEDILYLVLYIIHVSVEDGRFE